MVNGKKKKKKKVEIPWPKKTCGKIVGGPLRDGEKKTKKTRGVYRVNLGVFGCPMSKVANLTRGQLNRENEYFPFLVCS